MAAAAAQKSDFHARRDKAILSLLLFTGARRSELLNLQWDDLDTQGQTVRFVGAKGDKTRVVPMAPQLLSDLLGWQEIRPLCSHRHVSTSKSGSPLGKRGLRAALIPALEAAGIDKPGVITHKLRHTFACMMLRCGADLSCLQRMMGHSRLDTTGIYLSATAADLKELWAGIPSRQCPRTPAEWSSPATNAPM